MTYSLSPALKIALIYLGFSLLWIFTSDAIVALLSNDIDTLNFLQTVKGWFFVTATSLIIYLLANKYLNAEKVLQNNLEKKSKELENIIENSPVPTVVLREDGQFIYMNKIWLELTGYAFEEINTLQKWTQKAYKEEAQTKQKSIQELFNIEDINNNGEFIIQTKYDTQITWHFYSSLLGIKEGKKHLVATAIDVTELKQKNQLIIQQSKMAALGEMIENIAHQWRQPLSTIVTLSTGIEMQEKFGVVNKEEIIESMKNINKNAQYLDNTIHDFRNFFDRQKNKRYFKIDAAITKATDLMEQRIIRHDIEIAKITQNIEIEGFENELIQVLINLLNNAIDALKESSEQRLILIKTKQIEEQLVLTIKDSAGGIEESVLPHIFEAYFTTKQKDKGTGIGLFMSEEIITDHMSGSIEAYNTSYLYNENEFKGACFKITLPLQ